MSDAPNPLLACAERLDGASPSYLGPNNYAAVQLLCCLARMIAAPDEGTVEAVARSLAPSEPALAWHSYTDIARSVLRALAEKAGGAS